MPRSARIASLLPLAIAVSLAGCDLSDGPNRIVIHLDELNESGVSGTAILEPLNDRLTRVTVEYEGGVVTGAWITAGRCPDAAGDELATITPPDGTAQLPFEFFVDGLGQGSLSALFLRSGRYVACGEA